MKEGAATSTHTGDLSIHHKAIVHSALAEGGGNLLVASCYPLRHAYAIHRAHGLSEIPQVFLKALL